MNTDQKTIERAVAVCYRNADMFDNLARLAGRRASVLSVMYRKEGDAEWQQAKREDESQQSLRRLRNYHESLVWVMEHDSPIALSEKVSWAQGILKRDGQEVG
jgi:hypothetical protein